MHCALLLILLVASVSHSQQPLPALTLEEAQAEHLSASQAVALAMERLGIALASLRLAELDPYSIRTDLLRAGHAVTTTELGVAQAEADALVEAADAYMTALVARAERDVAELEHRIRSIEADAARARFAAGAITTLDLEAAERAEALALAAAAAAASDLATTMDDLWDLLPTERRGADLTHPDELPAVPELERVLATAEAAGAVVTAANGVAIAEAELAAMHPTINSRVAIAAAETALVDASRSLEDATERERRSLVEAHRAAIRAQEAMYAARGALELAHERLKVERARYENGLAAEVELLRAELAVAQAELGLISAERAHLLAVLPLKGAPGE